MAFNLFKYAGAIYLAYIGISGLKSSHSRMELKQESESSYLNYLKKGFITNILNPKCAIFLLAFLPRFIDETKGDVDAQIMTLGFINTILAVLFFSILALSVYKVKHFVEHNDRFIEMQEKVTSYIFLGLGLSIPIYDGLDYLNLI